MEQKCHAKAMSALAFRWRWRPHSTWLAYTLNSGAKINISAAAARRKWKINIDWYLVVPLQWSDLER